MMLTAVPNVQFHMPQLLLYALQWTINGLPLSGNPTWIPWCHIYTISCHTIQKCLITVNHSNTMKVSARLPDWPYELWRCHRETTAASCLLLILHHLLLHINTENTVEKHIMVTISTRPHEQHQRLFSMGPINQFVDSLHATSARCRWLKLKPTLAYPQKHIQEHVHMIFKQPSTIVVPRWQHKWAFPHSKEEGLLNLRLSSGWQRVMPFPQDFVVVPRCTTVSQVPVSCSWSKLGIIVANQIAWEGHAFSTD